MSAYTKEKIFWDSKFCVANLKCNIDGKILLVVSGAPIQILIEFFFSCVVLLLSLLFSFSCLLPFCTATVVTIIDGE